MGKVWSPGCLMVSGSKSSSKRDSSFQYRELTCARLSVAALDRRLTKHALLNDQLRLEGKRNKLKVDIEHFQATALRYIPRGEGVSGLSSGYTGEEWEDVEEDPDVDEPLAVNDPQSSSDQVNAEAIDLRLPSSLGKAELERIGKAELIDHELRLREGQANDALHRLRMTIGMKSVALRTSVRQSKHSQKKKTRAWREVQNLEKTVVEQARVYTMGWNAIKRLSLSDAEAKEVEDRFKAYKKTMRERKTDPRDADHEAYRDELKAWRRSLPETVKKFQPLEKEDLKATTHLLDHTERHSRQAELSWIWALDVGGDTENAEWLEERKVA